jgi:hypothetical protein
MTEAEVFSKFVEIFQFGGYRVYQRFVEIYQLNLHGSTNTILTKEAAPKKKPMRHESVRIWGWRVGGDFKHVW